MAVDIVLPAGGRIDSEFAREAGAEVKALIDVGGTTLLARVIGALRESRCGRRIVVVAPPEVRGHRDAAQADACIPDGETGTGNVFAGLEWILAQPGPPPERVLVVATDLPFVEAGAFPSLLDACPADADVCVPAYLREEFEARFPGSHNEYVELVDGAWTIGCAFVVNPRALLAARPHIDRVFAARKSQLRMAAMLGLPFIIRYLTRRLAVRHIEERCSRILDCRGVVIRGAAPELAYDIDVPESYVWAVSHARTPAA